MKTEIILKKNIMSLTFTNKNKVVFVRELYKHLINTQTVSDSYKGNLKFELLEITDSSDKVNPSDFIICIRQNKNDPQPKIISLYKNRDLFIWQGGRCKLPQK